MPAVSQAAAGHVVDAILDVGPSPAVSRTLPSLQTLRSTATARHTCTGRLQVPSSSAGHGQTIAVVDAYDLPTAEADLAVYRSTYGLPACTSANGCFRR